MASQPCARWGCEKQATYEKPLCRPHWLEWQAWELEECTRCHWIYDDLEAWTYWDGDWDKEFPFLCNDCLWHTLAEKHGKPGPGWPEPEERPIHAHVDLERPEYYVYVVKLSDGSFYPGSTNNLRVRMREHQDGLQRQTRRKNPRLVYYEYYKGDKRLAEEREDELTLMNQSGIGRRRIRELIEAFREPLRMVDFEA